MVRIRQLFPHLQAAPKPISIAACGFYIAIHIYYTYYYRTDSWRVVCKKKTKLLRNKWMWLYGAGRSRPAVADQFQLVSIWY